MCGNLMHAVTTQKRDDGINTYRSELGNAAVSIIDTDAFQGCDN